MSFSVKFRKFLYTMMDEPFFHTTMKYKNGVIQLNAIFNSVFIKELDGKYSKLEREDYNIGMSDQEKVALYIYDMFDMIVYGNDPLPEQELPTIGMRNDLDSVKTVVDLGDLGKRYEVRS